LMWKEVFKGDPSGVLVVAIGGGGDIVSAAVLASSLEREGIPTVIAALPWERFVLDPEPGPVPLDTVTPAERVTPHTLLAYPGCSFAHGGRVIPTQACRVGEVIQRPIYLLDLWGGEVAVRNGINEILELHDIDVVIGVDVGGDVLACGIEDTLWSPLADQIGLSAIANSNAREALLAVHSLGADGELPMETMLARIAKTLKLGGYRWIRGLTAPDIELLKAITAKALTEASRVSLEALKGVYADIVIRDGTRRVHVSPYSLATFILDARLLYKISPMARIVHGTTSIREARIKLNQACVYTELDLEEDLKTYEGKGLTEAQMIEEARRNGREEIMKTCNPFILRECFNT